MKRSGDFNVLTAKEVTAVSAAADQPYRALFLFAAFTGLRMGELRALRWTDVDFDRRSVFVRFSRTSAATERPSRTESAPSR